MCYIAGLPYHTFQWYILRDHMTNDVLVYHLLYSTGTCPFPFRMPLFCNMPFGMLLVHSIKGVLYSKVSRPALDPGTIAVAQAVLVPWLSLLVEAATASGRLARPSGGGRVVRVTDSVSNSAGLDAGAANGRRRPVSR